MKTFIMVLIIPYLALFLAEPISAQIVIDLHKEVSVRGDKITLPSRILSVCNAYDAMVSDKPYRKSLQADWAKDQLNAKAGSQFDPDIVQLFLDELDSNPAISKVQIHH